MRQLVLDLPVEPRFGVEDFLVGSSNEDAFATLERWPDWPADGLLVLTGPRGCGKSHLASIWAGWASAATVAARDVVGEAVPRLAAGDALLVEDLDGGPLDEPALFHLVNMARESRRSLLATTAAALDPAWLRTPDLLSRLRRAPSVALGYPDDALLKSVLVKLFLDRQLVVDIAVIDYVANRIERSLAKAAEFVADLDRETLSRGRRVTRHAAAEIVARYGALAEDGA